MRRFRSIYLAPVLAIVALFAWALASPMGAGPDDDYHLVSVWCAGGDQAECADGSSSAERVVPEAVLEAPCYAQLPEKSAACLNDLSFDPEPTETTKRGNFVGAYPPVFYSAMNVFVGEDILGSVVLMRAVNLLLFVGLTTALFLLLPVTRRPTLIWGWLITTVPMGLFLLASNNPSGWAVTGVGTAWIALLGYFETTGWRKWLLGAVFAVGTLMAAGSRGDAAVYAVLGMGAVFVLTAPWDRASRTWPTIRRYLLDAILPVAMVAVCAFFFLTSRQSQSGVSGFGGGSVGSDLPVPDAGASAEALTGFGRLAYNILNVPFLWAGNFGEWGLGWLDTSMPKVVTFGAIGCFVAVGFVGLSRLGWRKLLVVLGAGLTLWALPVYVLTAGGDVVGDAVQPRYVLPLIVLLGGLIMLVPRGESLRFTRLQLVLIVATLSVVNLVALHMNIRRYVTGIADAGWNLDADVRWWWNVPFTPMFVWIIGAAAYAALLAVLVRNIAWPRAVIDEAATALDPAPTAEAPAPHDAPLR